MHARAIAQGFAMHSHSRMCAFDNGVFKLGLRIVRCIRVRVLQVKVHGSGAASTFDSIHVIIRCMHVGLHSQ